MSPTGSAVHDGVVNAEVRPQSAAKSPIHRNCMLIVIGSLLVCSTIISLVIGHYHHLNLQEGIFSSSSSLMHLRLQDFLGEVSNNNTTTTIDNSKPPIQQSILSNSNSIEEGDRHERHAFENIIKRVQWTASQCNNIPPGQRNTVKKPLKVATELPMLPEGGVASVLEQWLKDKDNPKSSAISNTNTDDYPTCYIPPAKSCHVTTYTLIIMSHTTDRLQAFVDPVRDMINTWPGLTEVIIVWNSPREILTQASDNKAKEYATELLTWNDNTTHPLRIFFSLENGLQNNLLNRYHPRLQPKNEAVMYFDDDGPFWSREAMVYGGFELWKRNSNVQVGGFPRNIRYLSQRMKDLEKNNLQSSIDLVTRDVGGYMDEEHADFTPLCRNVTGDHVEYNYFTFPDFAGHVLLPSGTFLHRNYLCFIWHPAFEELRQWVVTHKTMPDDMTVSTMISHLSGRAPRTFPREVATARRRRLFDEIDKIQNDLPLTHNRSSTIHYNKRHLQSPPPDQSHRRLLWKQKGWGNMREEAVNSILGYFGSIHPGTVGWCAGTQYMRPNNRGVPFLCHPEKPTLDLIPWLTEGGIGSTQCPLDPSLLEQSAKLLAKHKAEKEAEQEALNKELGNFCGQCKYKGFTTCQGRIDYLVDKYNKSRLEAKDIVVKEDSNCEKKKDTR